MIEKYFFAFNDIHINYMQINFHLKKCSSNISHHELVNKNIHYILFRPSKTSILGAITKRFSTEEELAMVL